MRAWAVAVMDGGERTFYDVRLDFPRGGRMLEIREWGSERVRLRLFDASVETDDVFLTFRGYVREEGLPLGDLVEGELCRRVAVRLLVG